MIEEAIDECLSLVGNGKKLEKCTFPIDSSLVTTNLSDIQSIFWGKKLAPQALLELYSVGPERNIRLQLALLNEKKTKPPFSLVHELTLIDGQPPVLGSLVGQGIFLSKINTKNVITSDLEIFNRLVRQTQETYRPIIALTLEITKEIDEHLKLSPEGPKLPHCRLHLPTSLTNVWEVEQAKIEVYSIDSRPIRSLKPPFVRETNPRRMIEIYCTQKLHNGLFQDNLIEKLVLSEAELPKIMVLKGMKFWSPYFEQEILSYKHLQAYQICLRMGY